MRRVASLAVLALALVAAAALALLARGVLAAGDSSDPALAQAFRLFDAGHDADAPPDVLARNRRRAAALARSVAERDAEATARSRASNLLGILSFEDALVDGGDSERHVRVSLVALRRAVRLDPANDDAKFNLELLLTLLARREEGAKAGALPSGGKTGSATGAGASTARGGY